MGPRCTTRANADSMPAGVLQHPLQIGPESIPLPVAETFKVMVKHPAHRRQRGGEGFKTLRSDIDQHHAGILGRAFFRHQPLRAHGSDQFAKIGNIDHRLMRQIPLTNAVFFLKVRDHPPRRRGKSVRADGVGIGLGYDGKRMAAKAVFRAFSSTGIAVTQIVMIGSMAGIVIGVLNITGLGFALTQALIEMAAGNLFLLLLMAAVVSIVLGMGMPTLGVYLLLATLSAPSLIEVGVPPMAAHMLALYFGMLSMITPPVANTEPMKTGFAAVRFGWSAYVIPFLFVVSPALLMNAGPLEILIAAAAAVAGIWAVSVGLAGQLFAILGVPLRALFIAAGLALLVPGTLFVEAPMMNIAGAALVMVLIVAGNLQRKRRQG
jgi:TRAP-type uncharacterized transport system fused permease subunit